MADGADTSGPFRTADLSQTRPTRFTVRPGEPARAEIAEALGLSALKKAVFEGEITPEGKRGFRLKGHLGATVVQPCVVSLAPVTTRIETDVTRSFRPEPFFEEPEAGSEVEMPEDDTVDPLPEEIDPAEVMQEALALALPDYPRADGVEMDAVTAEPEGAEPIRDEDLKPFSGLAGLRDKLAGGDDREDD